MRLHHALVLPALLGYGLTDNAPLIDADVERWQRVTGRPARGVRGLLDCLTESTHEFRNVYFHRMHHGNARGRMAGRFLRRIYRTEPTLHLSTGDIGPGLYIQHGFATIVAAMRIGADCWINQQVTIGFDVAADGAPAQGPVIGDGVSIYAGAKVIGGIRVGDRATVGAGAVVIRDVPDDMVAVGVPAVARPARQVARSQR